MDIEWRFAMALRANKPSVVSLIAPLAAALAYAALAFNGDLLRVFGFSDWPADMPGWILGVAFYSITVVSAVYCIYKFQLKRTESLIACVAVFLYLCAMVYIVWIIHPEIISAPDAYKAEAQEVAVDILTIFFAIPYILIWFLSYWIVKMFFRRKSAAAADIF